MGWDRQRRPRKNGYGAEWEKARKRILFRDRYCCVNCKSYGKMVSATEVDHIIERAAGGSDEDDNLQSLCHDCHKQKTAHRKGVAPRPKIGLDGWPEGEGGSPDPGEA